MGWLGDYAAAKAIDVDMAPVRDQSINHFAKTLAARVEGACVIAIANGPGWRVWRSNIENRRDEDTSNWSLSYDIQLLEPGASAPGSGIIYGPWPENWQGMIAQNGATDG